ncbi:hypothetical protein BC835DRAFT_1241812, partial [Cytidiella melzeri]
NYSSANRQNTITREVQTCCNGKIPRWCQTDVGEAFLLGMDEILVSATGCGKTLVFLPCLLADDTNKSQLVIVSPLNMLENDMAARCNAMGLPALVVNAEQLAADKTLHQVILTSPEMIFCHPMFSNMMQDANWTKHFIGTVIDKAHCVLDWKDKFRTAFG